MAATMITTTTTSTISASAQVPRGLIRISKIASRYLVFDIDDAMTLRRAHNMCGVFGGTIPQNPQQNVFTGLPMELLAEEAAVLVARGVAHVVDDAAHHVARLGALTAAAHARGRPGPGAGGGDVNDGDLGAASLESGRAYLNDIKSERKKVEDEAMEQARQNRLLKAQHIKKIKAKKPTTPSLAEQGDMTDTAVSADIVGETVGPDGGEGLFGNRPPTDPATPPNPSTPHKSHDNAEEEKRQVFGVTPTTSGALLTPPPSTSRTASNPDTPPSQPQSPSTSPSTSTSTPMTPRAPPDIPVPASYPLYAHLHGRGYYQMPGLRFGCDYNVYPGDPLRFHSHFQATCYGWDEEIAVLDLVAGGRLGTGVKKGFLVGGAVADDESGPSEGRGGTGAGDADSLEVRAFCIEWAGM